MAKKKAAGKRCIHCNRTLPLDDFFMNKLWASQFCRDAWCKDCARKFVHDRETLRKYLFENNRKFKENGWEASKKKALYALSTNKKWIDADTPPEEKAKLAEEAIAQAYLRIMNMVAIYEYEENVRVNGTESTEDLVVHEFADPDDKPVYDDEWGGWFTPTEIRRLNKLYQKYSEDFKLDTINQSDYARKVIKASLNADIAEDKYRRGQVPVKEYEDARRVFDELSKSANFAASKRKPGENTGMGSLGEIILKLETDGFLNENPYTFPDDDVDRVVNDYLYTLRSIGADVKL